MAPAKTRSALLWTGSILLALFFLLSGSGKLANNPAPGMEGDWDGQFVAWGLPAWGRLAVGLAEVAGAVGLLVPALRFHAASGLALLMLGALGTHLANGELAQAPFPLVLGAVASLLAWATRPAWLAGRLRRSPSPPPA